MIGPIVSYVAMALITLVVIGFLDGKNSNRCDVPFTTLFSVFWPVYWICLIIYTICKVVEVTSKWTWRGGRAAIRACYRFGHAMGRAGQ